MQQRLPEGVATRRAGFQKAVRQPARTPSLEVWILQTQVWTPTTLDVCTKGPRLSVAQGLYGIRMSCPKRPSGLGGSGKGAGLSSTGGILAQALWNSSPQIIMWNYAATHPRRTPPLGTQGTDSPSSRVKIWNSVICLINHGSGTLQGTGRGHSPNRTEAG